MGVRRKMRFRSISIVILFTIDNRNSKLISGLPSSGC